MTGRHIPMNRKPVKIKGRVPEHTCEFPPNTTAFSKYDFELRKYARLDPAFQIGDFWKCECGKVWKLVIRAASYLKYNREWVTLNFLDRIKYRKRTNER